MMTRIRIDLSQGIVEAEGSEDFEKEIYNHFKDNLSKLSSLPKRDKYPGPGTKNERCDLSV